MKVAGGSGGPGPYDAGVQMAKAFMESKTGGVGGGPGGPNSGDKPDKVNWLGRLVKLVKNAGNKVKGILTGGNSGGGVKPLARRNAMRGGQVSDNPKPSGPIEHQKLGASGLGVRVMHNPDDPFGTNGSNSTSTRKLERQNAVRYSTESNDGRVNQSEDSGRD